MPNAAFIDARRAAGFSQYDLARAIRNYGFLHGDPNGCTREMVARWDRGTVRRPQPRYLRALEGVLGQPVENLGFDADLRHGINRAQLLAESGLDQPMQLPDPADSYGPLSGIWLSSYTYTSSGRGGTSFTSQHYAVLLQTGAQVLLRSVPKSASALSMALSVSGRVITGTWTEQTRPDGYYRGAVYTGAIQMLEKDHGFLDGRWIGFGKGEEINDGPWSLRQVSAQLSAGELSRWDLAA